MSACKSCVNKQQKQYYLNNQEKVKEKNKRWHLNNHEKTKERSKQYRLNNPEKIKKYQKENAEKLREYKKEHGKRYYQENIDKIKERQKVNSKKIRETQKKYHNTRYKECPEYKLLCILRRRIQHVIKGNSKFAPSLELLGCTPEEVRNHLQSQFTEGMTWGNHGQHGWHVDHIRPCASFDMSEPEQQKACFHYTNLQPLWAEDNFKKGVN